MYAWGDNDHGQQGNATTTVNRKPALVHGLEGHRVSRVACGSSHSVCWTSQDTPSANCHEPVLFTESKDPLGAGFVNNNTLSNQTDSNTASNVATVAASNHTGTLMSGTSSLPHNFMLRSSKPSRPSLARIILSLESNAAKQQALQHILNALQILYSREAVVSSLAPHGGQPSNTSKLQPATNNFEAAEAAKATVPLASPESPSDINEESVADLISGGGGEAPACPTDLSLQTSPESEEPSSGNSVFAERGYTKLSSLPHGLSPSSVMAGAMISSPLSEVSSVESRLFQEKAVASKIGTLFLHIADEFTRLLCPDDARMLVDLLKLAVAGR